MEKPAGFTERKWLAGSWVYYRNWGDTQIEVVAKQNERHQWIILSVWSRPATENYMRTESFLSFIFKKLFARK